MPATHVALLRAVNLPNAGKIAMADLRALCEDVGLTDVRTVLQSGNVVFGAGRRGAPQLERLLETELLQRFDVRTSVIVRDGPALRDAIARNPFPAEATTDPGRLLVVFCKATPPGDATDALRAKIVGRERAQ